MFPLKSGEFFLGDAMSRAGHHEAEVITGAAEWRLGLKRGEGLPRFW